MSTNHRAGANNIYIVDEERDNSSRRFLIIGHFFGREISDWLKIHVRPVAPFTAAAFSSTIKICLTVNDADETAGFVFLVIKTTGTLYLS